MTLKSNFFNTNYNSRIESIYFNSKSNISIDLKREDEIHSQVSGNKFRKLKYNIKEAIQQNKNTILTYGGAYSNHISATAAAANMYGLKSIGVIRGEELKIAESENRLNPTLSFAKRQGMTLHFVDRATYQQKDNPEELQKLNQKFGDFYAIPEGGTNALAVKGCEEILSKSDNKYDLIACCVGTGGTLAGLINASEEHQTIFGFSALKGHAHNDIRRYTARTNWKIFEDDVFGGYAKTNEELVEFINSFYRCTSIKLDPIYTGKMVFRLFEMLDNNQISEHTKILAIHSGGLQGIDGFNQLQHKKGKPAIIFETK